MKEPSSDRGTTENPGNMALLVIDVQHGLFGKATPIYQAAELLHNILALVDRAHGAGAPVVYIQHSDQKALVKDSSDWQLHPGLQPLPTDYRIDKLHGDAFQDTILDEALRARNVTRLVITGLVTQGCVRATCLGAVQLGYTVVLASDGHSTYSKQADTLIEEWNQKLSARKVELKASSQIRFSG